MVKKGKWYSKPGAAGEATARLVVAVEWSPSGRGVDVRYRTRWPTRLGTHTLAETTCTSSEWKSFMKWGGAEMTDGWEPCWLKDAVKGPSIKD